VVTGSPGQAGRSSEIIVSAKPICRLDSGSPAFSDPVVLNGIAGSSPVKPGDDGAVFIGARRRGDFAGVDPSDIVLAPL
jgi:hypothetical protein